MCVSDVLWRWMFFNILYTGGIDMQLAWISKRLSRTCRIFFLCLDEICNSSLHSCVILCPFFECLTSYFPWKKSKQMPRSNAIIWYFIQRTWNPMFLGKAIWPLRVEIPTRVRNLERCRRWSARDTSCRLMSGWVVCIWEATLPWMGYLVGEQNFVFYLRPMLHLVLS